MSRALVLSGGGPVGIAWELGIAAGLASKGVVLAEADFIVGTSAGSAVGAQVALGRDLDTQVERYRSGESASRSERPRSTRAIGATAAQMQALMQAMAELFTSDAPPDEARAAVGRFALEADTVSEEEFIAGFGHLRDAAWPPRYACTAVDAVSGEFVVWDAEAGVELVRAVASSCAVPGIFPPITINGRRYLDGGMRSATNADLAAGHDRVLIVSLVGGAGRGGDPRMERYLRLMDDEVAALGEAGAEVATLAPDAETVAALGVNLMDPSRRFEAAEAGVRQGQYEADRLRDFWR